MIKAEITVNTLCGKSEIPVQVLDAGPREGTVWVQALNGLEPFTRFSHGGPFRTDTSVFSISGLRNIQSTGETLPSFLSCFSGLETPQKAIDTFLEGSYEDLTHYE